MKGTDGVPGGRLRTAVSLQDSDGTRHFLADHELALADDGSAQPVEYDGRRYRFSHIATVAGYDGDVRGQLYVFREG